VGAGGSTFVDIEINFKMRHMKTNVTIGQLALTIFLLLPAVLVSAQTDEEPEKQRRVKMVKLVDGERIVLDTLISGDDANFAWMDELDLPCQLDSSLKRKLNRFRYEFSDSENEEVFVFAPGDRPFMRHQGNRMFMRDSIMEGDSVRKVMRIRRGDGPMGGNGRFWHDRAVVHVPRPPYPPMRILHLGKHPDDKMVIHLDDPNVLSYKKKDLSGGREKIEVIRKKQADQAEDFEFDEEIIIEEE
jgi:hypothetical protein